MAITNLSEHMSREYVDKLQTARANRSMHGERRVVTILFCDVKGSTSMAGKLDPEDWAEVMNEAFEYLISPIYRYEGTVARLMGDAILAFFGAPIAHEDDPQRAVLAGLDILKDIQPFCDEIKHEYGLDFGVRVGVHTGPVVVGEIGSNLAMEYTAMGDAANVAARMEETAEPGTIQISESTYKLVAPLFQIEALGDVELKGKDEPIKTYRVVDVKADPGKVRGIEGLDTPLVGRSQEMEVLLHALTDLRQGRGGIVSVLGEAGLGKSRLIEEMHKETRQDVSEEPTWFFCRGISFATAQPYGLFQQLLRKLTGVNEHDTPELAREKIASYLDQIPSEQHEITRQAFEVLLAIGKETEISELEGEAFQRELYTALENIWRDSARTQPVIYVFDDLHWADSASIELLLHLLQLVDEIPVLFLCASRPYRQSLGWQVKLHAETNYPHRYQEIKLNPLRLEESQELIHRLIQITDLPLDLQSLILQKAEGIPFFVEEVIRSLIDQGIILRDEAGNFRYTSTDLTHVIIPDNLQALLTARIDRLNSEVRSTLQYAAVIGRSFYQRILKWVSELEEEIDEHLITLQRVELIQETSRIPEIEYVFRHELTRDAAYRTILRKERKKFHLRVAEALENAFPDKIEDLAPRLAHHFDQAGKYEKALMYYTKAGEIAAKLYANKEAINLLTRAIELTEFIDISPADRIHIYLLRGRTFEVISQWDDAIDNYQELEAYGIEHQIPEIELAAIIPHATILSIPTGRIDIDEGRNLSERGLELAEKLQDLKSKAKILWNLLLISYFTPEEANVEFGIEAMSIAREHNSKEDLAYILHDLGRVYASINKFEEAKGHLQESQGYWRELGNLPMLADSLTMAAYVQLEAGNFERALTLSQESLEISQSINNLWGQAYSLTMIAPALIELGRISEGIQRIQEGQKIAQDAKFIGMKILSPSVLSWLYASLGDFSQSNEMLEQAWIDVQDMEMFLRHVQIITAWVKYREGHRSEAFDLLEEALSQDATEFPDVFLGSLLTNLQTEIELERGELETALCLAEENTKDMEEGGRALFLPDALRLKANVLMQLGREEDGRQTLLEAKKLAERLDARRSLVFILHSLLDIARYLGNSEEIESLRTQGEEVASYLADHIHDPDLKQTFLNLEEVRNLYE